LAVFSVHFDGPITIDHRVPIRVLAKTYEHMQRAIDRAYLIELHGEVWKHARLKANQYRETDFIAEYPREGGIILDAVREGAGAVLDRIAGSIRPVFEAALAARSTDLWERMRISRASQHNNQLQSFSERQTALEFIDKSLSEPRARLRSLCAVAELLGGLGVGCLIAAFWGNILDGILGAAISSVAIGLQVSAVQLFIADYLGPAMLKAKLQGRKPPEPTGIV
jgi:hypothetical protein